MMKIIGLTGQSGAGKGAVCSAFAKHHIPAVDTDCVYHEILKERGACTDELVERFGTAILDANGLVDRRALGAIVFGSEDKEQSLSALNRITHKYVMEKTMSLVREWEKKGAKAVIIDAPQLFEAKADRVCDVVIGVLADRELRIGRIIARDGITREQALLRIDAQHEDAYYRTHCDYILENNGDLAELIERASALCYELGLGEDR